MGFNFPNSPAPGDLYQPVGGPSYTWDAQKWVMTGSPLQVTPAYDQRNRIVNPAMQVSQENGSNNVSTSGAYPADQWLYSFVGPVGSVAQRILGLSVGLPNLIRILSATVLAAPSAAQYGLFLQYLEGIKVADFLWGTAKALPVVLRFRIRCSVSPSTFGLSLRSTGNRTFVRNLTFNAPVDTYQDFVVPIPGCTDGTWAVDNSASFNLGFTAMAGSNWIAPTTGWQVGNYLAVAGIGNIYAVTGQSFDVAEVGLYLDPFGTGLPPAWEMPDEASELIACKRYWQKSFPLFSGNVTSGALYYGFGNWGVPPRPSAIAISGTNSGAACFPATVGGFIFVDNGFYETRTANASGAGVFDSNCILNARM